MSRGVRIGAWIGGGLLLLVLAAVLVVAWVLGTQAGTRFAADQARGWLPAGATVGEVNGRLWDRIEVHDVIVEQAGATTSIEHLVLDWAASALAGGTLHVEALELSGVVYRVNPDAPPPPDDAPLQLPERIDLPVGVRVDRVTVDQLAVVTAPEAPPLQVTRIYVADTRLREAKLTVGEVKVEAPAASARGDLTATLGGAYPLDVDLAWHVRPAGYAPLDGTTAVTGDLKALSFEQSIGPPYRLQATGRVQDVLGGAESPAVDATLSIDELSPAQVRAEWPEATVSLQTRVQGPLESLGISASARARDPQQRQLLAELRAQLNQRTLEIEQLRLSQPERAGELSGRGSIALAAGAVADLQISWSELAWPLTGEPTVRVPQGHLTLQGPFDDYRLDLETRVVAGDKLPSLDLELDGTGTDRGARLNLAIRSSAGNVAGEADVAWAPQLQGEVRLELDEVDPSVMAADWPGRVSGRLAGAGRQTDRGLEVELERLEADGTLRAMPLAAAAQGSFAQRDGQRALQVDSLSLRLGPSHLDVAGAVREQADLSWELASDDLASLGTGLRGSVQGSGNVRGEVPRVRVEGTLRGRELGWKAHQVQQLNVVADVDLSGGSRSRLSVEAGPGTVGGEALSQLTLEATGTPGEHRLELALDAQPATAGVALAGQFEDPWGDAPEWHYTLSRGRLAYRGLPAWQLARPAGGRVAAAHVQVDEQCWRTADAELCFGGHRNARELAATVDLANLDFTYFSALLPEAVALQGALDAEGRATWPSDGVLTARLEARTTAGALTLAAAPELARQEVTVDLEPSRLTVVVDPDQARADLDLVTGQGRIQAEAGTPATWLTGTGGVQTERPTEQLPLDGRLRIRIPDLSRVAALLPQVESLRGRIEGDMRIDGTLGNPALHGATTLADGAVTVPEPGLEISDLRARLTGRGRSGLGVEASAVSGGGTLSVSGQLQFPGMPPTADLTISGNAFQVVNNSDARLYVSPALEVRADERQVQVVGAVRVPRAEITPGSRTPGAVTASEDQVLVSPEAQEPLTERPLLAEIRLILGEDVHFDGFGLTADLQGNVLVKQQPDTPVTASGEIQLVEGEYRAYGQGLVIDEGRIYFAGPVTEPALDIRAVRRPEEGILVGAHVQGTLQAPTFELFSDPSMSQQEQLSYLVLGRSLEEAPDGESSALNRAVLAMGLKGGDFLAQNLGERLGVDEIGIQTGSGEAGAPSDPNDAALVVGKYLSPRLYVSYGIGLFDPTSVLQMQYEIASNWKLVTESSSDATGADLLYSVELGGN